MSVILTGTSFGYKTQRRVNAVVTRFFSSFLVIFAFDLVTEIRPEFLVQANVGKIWQRSRPRQRDASNVKMERITRRFLFIPHSGHVTTYKQSKTLRGLHPDDIPHVPSLRQLCLTTPTGL